ncbi:hypothetical protein DSCW_04380 [Desulfosarcina widdelii]|uniref:Phospholipase C n=1 Tax=Desulfosarcina widdelii TaxID=947919 RepID=A0A5K7Z0P3_9BACT|nr:hypothetical protein [Desulfosarcina widdelii]BBO73021.1 hypothetical protein DSCW_04380 [Desulfosarcina widdelii]
MRISKIKMVVLLLLYSLIFNQGSEAYDNEYTHPYINEKAVKENPKVNTILKESVGLTEGIETKFCGKEIWEWIRDGGIQEDEPEWRCFRHFHDPLNASWDDAGLLSLYKSMIYWAQTPDPGNDYDLYNEYSWLLAREYYHQALLTGSEEQYAKTFRSLGQLMHLVSDAALPAHVRNDAHPKFFEEITIYDDSDPYENWVENNHKKIKKIEYERFTVDQAIFDMAVENSSAPIPISALWDHDEYQKDGSNLPDGWNNTIGLAEYTNANFWTEDTRDDYPHPILSDTDYKDKWLNPEIVDGEDGQEDRRVYFSKQEGEPIEHFVAADYWHYQLYIFNKPEVKYSFFLDEECHRDYAEKLIPRAIGYSAALLDYFFRGQMQVTARPYFYDNSLYTINLKIENTTPSEETMSAGTFTLVFRYTPAGGSPDGSDDIFVPASQQADCTELLFNDSMDLWFYPSDEIPIECLDSVKCTLAFQGTLGNETGAVVGKVFTPGTILFNEEWDQGLTDSHPWESTPDSQNEDNGTSTKTVADGRLTMELVRNADFETARVNDLWMDFTVNGSEGLLIPEGTDLQFIIEEMSTTSSDSPVANHIMGLNFNEGLMLQYSDQGPYLYWNDTTLYLQFTPGQIIADNIHSLFQNAGISIPDPLYLEDISLLQQVHDSAGAYQLFMEVDAIRLVGPK